MSDTKQVSFLKRVSRGQRGNAVIYIVIFAILWFVGFSLIDWIKSTKDGRVETEAKIRAAQYQHLQDDIYKNPYQISGEDTQSQ